MIIAPNKDHNVINKHPIKFEFKRSILLWMLWIDVNKVNYKLFHVECRYVLLSNFNQAWDFETEFNKCLKYQVLRKSDQWESNL